MHNHANVALLQTTSSASKTFSEQSGSHRAGNREQRLYLEGMRPLGGSGYIFVSYDWLQGKHEESVQCGIQRAPWALDEEKRSTESRKTFCLYEQLWQDLFWNIKFISGIYIRKRTLKFGDVTKRSYKNNFKWIPCWECFKEVHLFGLSKERCRSYLTLSSEYLPDVNVLLSLPKKSGSKTNAWNRTKKRKHIVRAMGDYFLEELAKKNKGFSISWCLEIKTECLSIK